MVPDVGVVSVEAVDANVVARDGNVLEEGIANAFVNNTNLSARRHFAHGSDSPSV